MHKFYILVVAALHSCTDIQQNEIERARSAFQEGDHIQAVFASRNALDKDHTNVEMLAIQLRSLVELQDCAAAHDAALDMYELTNDPVAFIYVAHCHDRSGNRERANSIYDTLRFDDLAHLPVPARRVQARMGIGAVHYIKEDVDAWVSMEPASAEAWLALGTFYHLTGVADSAVIAYNKSMRTDTSSWLAHFRLSMVQAELGQYGEALSLNAAAIRHGPADAYLELLRERGILFQRLGQLDSACAIWQGALWDEVSEDLVRKYCINAR